MHSLLWKVQGAARTRTNRGAWACQGQGTDNGEKGSSSSNQGKRGDDAEKGGKNKQEKEKEEEEDAKPEEQKEAEEEEEEEEEERRGVRRPSHAHVGVRGSGRFQWHQVDESFKMVEPT